MAEAPFVQRGTVNKGALLQVETRAEMRLRGLPSIRAGAIFVGLGALFSVPILWHVDGLAGGMALTGALFVLVGALLMEQGRSIRHPARLHENGVDLPTLSGWSHFHSFFFVERISNAKSTLEGRLLRFENRARLSEFALPAGTSFSERAARQARHFMEHRPRPQPTMNPWVAAPRVQSSRRANVK